VRSATSVWTTGSEAVPKKISTAFDISEKAIGVSRPEHPDHIVFIKLKRRALQEHGDVYHINVY